MCDLLAGDYEKPTNTQKQDFTWFAWDRVSEDEGRKRVLENHRSLLIEGSPGTGKSTYCKGLCDELEKQGETVARLSKCHAACARMGTGALTLDYFVRKHILRGTCKFTWLWIDEVYQMQACLAHQINKLQGRCRFLLSGDGNQFGALFDYHCGQAIDEHALEKSRFLHELAGGTRVRLNECRRSDKRLFDFYSSLLAGGARFAKSLNDCVTDATQEFPYRGGHYAQHLCISHKRRVALNAQCNRWHKNEHERSTGEVCEWVAVAAEKGQLCAAQGFWLYAGLKLVGCTSTAGAIKNQCRYDLTRWSDDHVWVVGPDGEAQLTWFQMKKWTRLAYAQTYASCQGGEFDELCMHDVRNRRHFTKTTLYVGLSRCKNADRCAVVEAPL